MPISLLLSNQKIGPLGAMLNLMFTIMIPIKINSSKIFDASECFISDENGNMILFESFEDADQYRDDWEINGQVIELLTEL